MWSWSLFTAIKTLIRQIQVSTRDWSIGFDRPDETLFGEMCTLGLWIRKAVEGFKCGLKGHPSRNIEDSGTVGDLKCGTLAQEAFK